MKRIALLISFYLGIAPAFAQLTGNQSDYEPFADSTSFGGTAYTIGQPLYGNSPKLAPGFDSVATAGVGTPSWWQYTDAVTAKTTPSPTIVAGDLSYPGLSASVSGRSAEFYGNGTSALMNLTTDTGAIGYTAALGYTTIYYSFTLRVSDLSALPTAQNGADLIAGFTKVESHKNTSATPNSIGAQLWIRSDGATGYQLGIEGGSGANNVLATPTFDVTSHQIGETLFIVGQYDFTTTTGSLWINPTPGGSQPAPTLTDLATSAMQRVASFTLFGDNPEVGSGNFPIVGQMDNLRDGLTWASVTPVPEPSTCAFASLGLAALTQSRRSRNGRKEVRS
jgi:hypothetical protein